jgi:Thioesterase-like superfamily
MAVLSLPSLPSWRTTIIFIYLLANIKSLPFGWHIRLLYHFVTNIHRRPTPAPALKSVTSSVTESSHTRKILSHPLFQATEITTHTPLLETDYNLHKSNSTYFSDMDVSRTKLITRLFSPGFRRLRLELEGHGHKGRMGVLLGGVHVSFRREVGIYERVKIRSRVLAWDEKWVVIISYFVRNGRNGDNVGGKSEGICAVGISKYVLKKGRFTVKPERIFTASGWLPNKPHGEANGEAKQASEKGIERALTAHDPPPDRSASIEESNKQDTVQKEGGLSLLQLPETVEKVIFDEEGAAAAVGESNKEEERTAWNAEAWSWEDVEDERLRGLQLAKGWMALDGELYGEFERS